MAKTTAKKTSAKVTSTKKDVKAAAKKIDAAQDKIVDAAENIVSARIDVAQKVAKQAWFASLGAFGRTFDEVQERYTTAGEEFQSNFTKLTKGRVKLVGDLVARGEKVQDQAEARFKEGRTNVEEQIETAKGRFLSLTSVMDIPARLQDVSDKLESLSKGLKKSA